MTEDEFQQIVRYPDYDRDRILLCLVAALARLPAVEALGDVLEFLSRFAGLRGWRLADLSEGGPAGDEAALRAAVDALVGPLGRWKGPHFPEEERLARDFALLRTAWRALLALFAARGLDYPAQLAARAAAVGVVALPYRWSPPPELLPHDDPPFTVQFSGAGELHLLTMRGCTVALETDGQPTQTATFRGSDTAMLAFELNAQAFERAGLVAEASVPAELLGTLAPIREVDDRSTLEFEGDRLVTASIYDADPVAFYDVAVQGATYSGQTIGAFSPDADIGPGTIGIHLLRRLFAHPAAREWSPLTLILCDSFIAPIVDWLAARPEADRVTALMLHLPSNDQYGGIRSPPRPLGTMFPNLTELTCAYRSWPLWSAEPFPSLERLTLTGPVQFSAAGRIGYVPPLAELTNGIAVKVPQLATLTIG